MLRAAVVVVIAHALVEDRVGPRDGNGEGPGPVVVVRRGRKRLPVWAEDQDLVVAAGVLAARQHPQLRAGRSLDRIGRNRLVGRERAGHGRPGRQRRRGRQVVEAERVARRSAAVVRRERHRVGPGRQREHGRAGAVSFRVLEILRQHRPLRAGDGQHRLAVAEEAAQHEPRRVGERERVGVGVAADHLPGDLLAGRDRCAGRGGQLHSQAEPDLVRGGRQHRVLPGRGQREGELAACVAPGLRQDVAVRVQHRERHLGEAVVVRLVQHEVGVARSGRGEAVGERGLAGGEAAGGGRAVRRQRDSRCLQVEKVETVARAAVWRGHGELVRAGQRQRDLVRVVAEGAARLRPSRPGEGPGRVATVVQRVEVELRARSEREGVAVGPAGRRGLIGHGRAQRDRRAGRRRRRRLPVQAGADRHGRRGLAEIAHHQERVGPGRAQHEAGLALGAFRPEHAAAIRVHQLPRRRTRAALHGERDGVARLRAERVERGPARRPVSGGDRGAERERRGGGRVQQPERE